MSFNNRPKAIVCYICGQQYGTASIDIHTGNCAKKWDKVESLKPLRERRPCPTKPKNFDAAIKGTKNGGYDLDAYNAEAFEEYNTKALMACDGCGRTFLPDSLVKH